MKRILVTLTTVIFLITCSSCSFSQISSSNEINSNNKAENTNGNTLLNSANASETEKNEPQTFTKDYDGILITVTTDKTEYIFDEIIKVTASVKNNRNETVTMYVGTTTPVHAEISTKITRNGRYLCDPVTEKYTHTNCEINSIDIEPGEEYVQEMDYETYFTADSGGTHEQAEEGLYYGKSGILLYNFHNDPSDYELVDYSLDFSLTITDRSHENSKNDPQTFTKEFDGLVMTVTTDKTKYLFDEIIKVTASVKNTGNETLNLFVPTSSPYTHQEIYTTITRNGNFLCDPVTTDGFDEGTATVYIEPGKEYVQEMNYETYYFSFGSGKGSQRAEEGLYSGKCTISLRTDPREPSESSFKNYSLDFSLILGSEEESRHELCENKPQTITKDHNGIIMTVKTDKRRYETDEPIYVEASVKNTTDKAIHLFVPCLGDSHKQIETIIYNFHRSLIDVDTFMQSFDQAIDVVTIEPNEEYTQKMTYETYSGIDTADREQAEESLYLGKSIIKLVDDYDGTLPDAYYSYCTLEFSIIVGSPSFAETK